MLYSPQAHDGMFLAYCPNPKCVHKTNGFEVETGKSGKCPECELPYRFDAALNIRFETRDYSHIWKEKKTNAQETGGKPL